MARPIVHRWRWKYIPRNAEVYVWEDKFLLRWVSKSGFAYCSVIVPFASRDGEDQRMEIFTRIWEGPVKRKDVKKIAGVKWHADPKELQKLYPNLSEFLTAAVYEGGSEIRESPTVTLWCSGGEWKCSVKDRAEHLVMWLSDISLVALVQLLEDFCLNVNGPWRHEDAAHERNGKRVRK